jgi:anaerobic selenocysteine-containing dehydrogenase
MPYTYGSNDGNSTSDIENSKLVVMFGNNPAETPHERRRDYLLSGAGPRAVKRANDRYRPALYRYGSRTRR